MKAFLLSIGFCFLSVSSSFAQQDTTTVESQLEQVFEEFDEENAEGDAERLTQFLQDLAENPVNLNSASADEFLQIPGFNLKLAKAVVEYRRRNPFQRKEDLLNVSGIGRVAYARISPYVTIGGIGDQFRNLFTNPAYWTNNGRFEGISRYQQTLETQEGFSRPDSLGGFLGNPVRYFQRFRYRSEHLSLNLTQEKDAGEELANPGDFDYNSFHIGIENVGQVKRLVIGDYALSFGQGLVLWNGGAFGKGREVISTVGRNERGIRPYSSAQETDFFRGVAATVGNSLQGTVFFSSRQLTSSIVDDGIVRFPSASGFHRTLSEQSRRQNLGQRLIGGRIRYESSQGLFGVTAYQTEFDQFIERGSGLSSQFDFQGDNHSVIGVDYRGIFGDVLLFGEAARSQNNAYAGIIGTELPLSANTEVSAAYRNFAKDFQSFFGDAFGEASGDPQNEEGFYVGLRHTPLRWLQLSAYFDQYRFAAPRSGTSQPTEGYDILGLAELSISRRLSGYVLFRNEIRDDEFESSDAFGRELRILGKSRRASVRTQIDFQANRRIRLRSRFEVVRSRNANESAEFGYLVYQDIRAQLNSKLQVDGRVTIFDTDSFNARVFQFENDLLNVLTNTALSDAGQRMYILVNYSPYPYLQFSAKYSITVIEDAFTLSSGLNEIQGDTRSQIGLQARIRF